MHFVALKSQDQQAVLMVHRARTRVLANRAALTNQICCAWGVRPGGGWADVTGDSRLAL
jgi:hypothetical protein